MRVFVGLELDSAMKDALSNCALEAKKLFPGRYALRDNYHCTLQFIGQAEEKRIIDIEKRLREAASQSGTFSFSLTRLSYFHRPQDAVLFCGLSQSQPLEMLAKDVREGLIKAGFVLEEAGFHPHITLARQARIVPERLPEIPVVHACQQVTEITLFESCRVEDQLRYVPLFRCPLGK